MKTNTNVRPLKKNWALSKCQAADEESVPGRESTPTPTIALTKLKISLVTVAVPPKLLVTPTTAGFLLFVLLDETCGGFLVAAPPRTERNALAWEEMDEKDGDNDEHRCIDAITSALLNNIKPNAKITETNVFIMVLQNADLGVTTICDSAFHVEVGQKTRLSHHRHFFTMRVWLLLPLILALLESFLTAHNGVLAFSLSHLVAPTVSSSSLPHAVGRMDQHRRSLIVKRSSTVVSSDTGTSTINEKSEITNEDDISIPTSLPSEKGVDYVPLATMLATGQFQEADQVRLMISFVSC
jgi:hypothetical protein